MFQEGRIIWKSQTGPAGRLRDLVVLRAVGGDSESIIEKEESITNKSGTYFCDSENEK